MRRAFWNFVVFLKQVKLSVFDRQASFIHPSYADSSYVVPFTLLTCLTLHWLQMFSQKYMIKEQPQDDLGLQLCWCTASTRWNKVPWGQGSFWRGARQYQLSCYGAIWWMSLIDSQPLKSDCRGRIILLYLGSQSLALSGSSHPSVSRWGQ